VFVGGTLVYVEVGARTTSSVIVGEVEQAAKNNNPNRATNRIRQRFKVFILPVYRRSVATFARPAYAYSMVP